MKIAYMNRMNEVVAPFIICLILLLGICVPKRLLSTIWLNRITALLLTCVVPTGFFYGVKASLFFILGSLPSIADHCLAHGPGRKQKPSFS